MTSLNQLVEQSQPEFIPVDFVPPTPKRGRKIILFALLIVFFLAILIGVYYFFFRSDNIAPNLFIGEHAKGVEKFKSEEDFKQYLAAASQKFGEGYVGFSGNSMNSVGRGEVMMAPQDGSLNLMEDSGSETLSLPSSATGSDSGSSRYSETNVQVAGIDEPDFIKTNGKEIYFSDQDLRLLERSSDTLSITRKSGTLAIKAFPPSDLNYENITAIAKNGQLLLSKQNLLIVGNENIVGFNISDPKNPKETWQLNLKDNDYMEAVRLYGDKLYIITRNMIKSDCLIKPMTINSREVVVNCSDIYHPKEILPIDTAFSVFRIDVASGNLEDQTTFVGSSGSAIVYMSANAVYVTYEYPGDLIGYISGLLQDSKDLFPADLIARIAKLQTMDIGISAKMAEFSDIFSKFQNSLSYDEALKFENEFENRAKTYQKEHVRDLEKTGIVKIGLNPMKVLANGSVPGLPLNQFSLDEFEDHLRIATTFGNSGIFGNGESASDVYVLDKNLNVDGSVRDLGKTERIYSVRFIGDKGYVVTFRQTDPFYVLDLKNAKSPRLAGELKIPGFSSYLHPLDKNIILGVGMENGKVKFSIFDVNDPSNPVEKSKYNMDEYWTEAASNHHAFLQDERHKIFFIPGSKGAYIFSYKDNNLSLVKAIAEEQFNPASYGDTVQYYWRGNNIKRAVYLDDYLYVMNSSRLIVLDEKTWETVKEIDLISGGQVVEAKVLFVSGKEDARRLADVKQIQTALELYYQDANGYPQTTKPIILGSTDYSVICYSSNSTASGFMATSKPCENNNGTLYMSRVPINPEPGGTPYTYSSNGQAYSLTFSLVEGVGNLKSGLHTASPSGIQ